MSDQLTGLYNRSNFFKELDGAVWRATEYSAPLGLLIIDVRRFKKLNYSYGYRAGDKVLIGVSEVLKKVCRKGDMVARIGDDQFALLLSRIANLGHAELAARKIQRLLDVPIEAGGRLIRCATRIGISHFPSQAHDGEGLVQIASQALDDARRLDVPICYTDIEGNEGISNDWDIELSLGESINNSELEVYFQPKISLSTNLPVGAEALVRWNSPMRGLISPGEFLPVAETIGFLKPLSIWVLNSALRYSMDWTDKWGKLGVSVNIPPSMMVQADFVDTVFSAENLWQRDNSVLCLEILEESLVDDVATVFERLSELRDSGVKISVDDFGTGYSCISYFRDIPADELKIDQSFIKDLATNDANKNLVSLIIDMAHLFGMQVVAEGVEDLEAIRYLQNKGCDIIQGYYIAKPMPAAEFQDWLDSYEPRS